MRVLRGVVYMMKSRGERTEPWGTPQEEAHKDEKVLVWGTPPASCLHPFPDMKSWIKQWQ